MNEKMSLLLTSCGRLDLLNRTLESFFEFNNFPLEALYLTEDSADPHVYAKIRHRWGKRLKILFNKKKKGQIKSIVDAYKLINTPYIFHCEDDWVYKRKNFIQDSLKVLEYDEKIIQVWLINQKSTSSFDIFSYGPLKKHKGIQFREVYCKEGWEWGYFSFNPGVKRMKDYKLIGGYEKYKNELDIGVTYKKLGYYTVILEEYAVEHIGSNQSIFDPTRKWPKRRKTNAPTGFKRLWKHLRNFKFL